MTETSNIMTRDQALEWCFERLKPSFFDDIKEYNKYRLIRNRYKKGIAKEKAINTLLERFNVLVECTYTVPDTSADKNTGS